MASWDRTTDAADREEFAGWVSAQLADIAARDFDIWDRAALERAGRPAMHDADAFVGPWRNVRPYVTEEFRRWVEDEGDRDRHVRWTFAEWRAARRVEREREQTAAEDTENLLGQLEYMRDLMSRRGDMIASLREQGQPWAVICEAAGLSRMQAHTLAKAAREPF